MASFSQASPSSSPAADSSNWLNHGQGGVLHPLLATLSVVLFLLLCYYTWRVLCNKSLRLNETATVGPSSEGSSPSASMRNARLNPAVLASLPIFVYSMNGDEKLECSVCLAEVKDGEKGRLLPRCNHRFHVECVDMWFQSCSTCPICRTAIEPKDSGSDEAV